MALPLVLAGPILRRVEPRSVSVWMAFSEAQPNLELHLWLNIVAVGKEPDKLAEPPQPPDLKATGATIRVGPNIHIGCITLKLDPPPEPPPGPPPLPMPPSTPPLLPNQLYSYNVVFFGGATKKDLRFEGFLDESFTPRRRLPLGYAKGSLPSFMTSPMNLGDVKIAHGSCRKIHGYGKDALAALDFLVEKNVKDITERPQQLFLTGDQIYADEVPAILLPELLKTADDLFTGVTEHLEATASLTATAGFDFFPPLLRQHLLVDTGGFSSNAAACHVVSFKEFAVLYLYYWSNQLWPDVLLKIDKDIKDKSKEADMTKLVNDTFATLKTAIEHALTSSPAMSDLYLDDGLKKVFVARDPDAVKKWEKQTKKSIKEEIPNIVAFREALPRASRVMANVPTYMICDDHEITDDWYITLNWRRKIFSHPLGKNVVRNGLMAYTLFQGWGNEPIAFTTGVKKDLLDQLVGALSTSTIPQGSNLDRIDELLGLKDKDEAPKIDWNYSVATGPTKTIVLDTRTRRKYDSGNAPPDLMADSALASQLPSGPITAGQEILFIVSPAPVLNWALMEEMISPLFALGNGLGQSGNVVIGSLMADLESWGLHVAGFEKFLSNLEQHKKVVLLSGDFHYAYTMAMDYWKNDPGPATPPARFIQLVASGFKNAILDNQSILVSGRIQQLVQSWLPAERVGWRDKHVSVSGKINPRNVIRLRKNPVAISPDGWFPGATTSPAKTDWAWRLGIVSDNRPEGDGTAGTRPGKISGFTSDFDVNNAGAVAAAYVETVKTHQSLLVKNAGRKIVWASNVGVIHLKRTAGKLSLVHNLLYQLTEDDPDTPPELYTVHEISLEPTTDAQPKLT